MEKVGKNLLGNSSKKGFNYNDLPTEKYTYGESRVSGGYAQPVYNNRKGVKASLNDAKTTLNVVFHELGGHGSSLNGELSSFKLDNPLVKIMMHNEKLRPQLKPFYQAVKNGDFKLAESQPLKMVV